MPTIDVSNLVGSFFHGHEIQERKKSVNKLGIMKVKEEEKMNKQHIVLHGNLEMQCNELNEEPKKKINTIQLVLTPQSSNKRI